MASDPITQRADGQVHVSPSWQPDATSGSKLREAAGHGPWALAWRRLRRNRVSLAFGVLFLVLVLVALAAPLYASEIAETTPERNRIADTIMVDG